MLTYTLSIYVRAGGSSLTSFDWKRELSCRKIETFRTCVLFNPCRECLEKTLIFLRDTRLLILLWISLCNSISLGKLESLMLDLDKFPTFCSAKRAEFWNPILVSRLSDLVLVPIFSANLFCIFIPPKGFYKNVVLENKV